MVLLTCLLIVIARVLDVSMGTLRMIMVVQGRRTWAFVLAFFEIIIWLTVVSGVITQLHTQPLYAVAYALGYALGNYIGMTVEQRLALGRQAVRIITRQGPEMAEVLRVAGRRVTQFDGYGRDGPVQELFLEIARREAVELVRQARECDPRCYFRVDDVRATSTAIAPVMRSPRWLGMLLKK
jgi:uncharacterized protein YebE (UPF0316 family)